MVVNSCIWCGEGVVIEATPSNPPTFFVCCPMCGASGPTCHTKDDATEQYNSIRKEIK